jgi:hypothetical protein
VRTGRLAVDADVRLQPDATAAIAGQLRQNALVVVTGASGAWLEIISGAAPGGYGWVPQDAVRFESPSAIAGPTTPSALSTPETPALTPTQSSTSQPARPAAKQAAPKLAGTLVFQDRNGGTIYRMQADGSGMHPIATGFEPALSPDGARIAFTRWDEPRGLWIADSDGGNARLLFGANQARSPAWTPDGGSILFERSLGSTQCANTPFGCLTPEEWRARFFGQDCLETPFGSVCFGDFSLITQNLTGLTRVDVADSSSRDLPAPRSARAPAQSPIDSTVLFVDDNGLEATRNEGDDPVRRLVDAPNLLAAAQYNPDGQFIYGSRKSGDHWDLWRWRADGSQATALTAPPALRDRPIHSVSPAVSPDGRYVAFLTDRSGKWELWVMNSDGSSQRPLAPDALAGVNFQYDFVTERMVDWGR